MPRRRVLQYKQDNTWPPIDDVVSDRNGPIDLSGVLSIRFLMRQDNSEGDLKIAATAQAGNDDTAAADGGVRYELQTGDMDTVGTFVGEWELIWVDGIASAPNGQGEYLEIVVSPNLA